MKKPGFFVLLILSLLIPACKSSPPAGEDPGPELAGAAEVSHETAEAGTAETGAAPPADGFSGEAVPPVSAVTEPGPELAETAAGALPPKNEPSPALPEPEAPPLPPAAPSPAGPEAEAESPSEPPPPAGPEAGAGSPPEPPPAPPPEEDARPSRLPPADEDASGIIREPEPRPVQPPPAAEPEFLPLAPPPAEADEGMVFSRIVRATVGQLVEIPFRGTGWTYLGELGARRGVAYDSRRIDPEGQSFVFRAEAVGIYALKFYRQDFIRDYILNDYVQVIVGETPESSAGWFNSPTDRGRVSAERWPSSLEEADAAVRNRAGAAAAPPATTGPAPQPGSAPTAESAGSRPGAEAPPTTRPAATGTPPPAGPGDEGIIPVRPPVAAGQPGAAEVETAPVSRESPASANSGLFLPEESLPEDYIQKAQEEFDAGRVAGALAVLDRFRERFPQGNDEVWWLYGQFYEANSPSRDIRTALDYYRRLIREYPQSRRYTDARRRIAYLERYYINIQ